MPHIRTLSPTQVRRLALVRQGLAGPRPPADQQAILDLIHELGCLQLDPINVVARSHLLVLWSRLGAFLGARDIVYSDQVPAGWRGALR